MRKKDNNLIHKEISKKNIIFAFSILVFLILLYTIFAYIRITGKNPNTLNVSVKKKPIYVPLFIDPEKVVYKARFNFTFDPQEVLIHYRYSENLDVVIKNCIGDLEIAQKLMNWSREQWEPGRPDPYPPINAVKILEEIRSGRTDGFCAQYNYIFVQALQSLGMKSRYVTIKNHEVTEVWISEFKKWVCFDPLYNSIYLSKENIPLSVIEIYRNGYNNEVINFSK